MGKGRKPLTITIDDVTKPARQWAQEHGVPFDTFYARVFRYQWDPGVALKTPTGRSRKRMSVRDQQRYDIARHRGKWVSSRQAREMLSISGGAFRSWVETGMIRTIKKDRERKFLLRDVIRVAATKTKPKA